MATNNRPKNWTIRRSIAAASSGGRMRLRVVSAFDRRGFVAVAFFLTRGGLPVALRAPPVLFADADAVRAEAIFDTGPVNDEV